MPGLAQLNYVVQVKVETLLCRQVNLGLSNYQKWRVLSHSSFGWQWRFLRCL